MNTLEIAKVTNNITNKRMINNFEEARKRKVDERYKWTCSFRVWSSQMTIRIGKFIYLFRIGKFKSYV